MLHKLVFSDFHKSPCTVRGQDNTENYLARICSSDGNKELHT